MVELCPKNISLFRKIRKYLEFILELFAGGQMKGKLITHVPRGEEDDFMKRKF
jgi:hypothetical protein